MSGANRAEGMVGSHLECEVRVGENLSDPGRFKELQQACMRHAGVRAFAIALSFYNNEVVKTLRA